MTDNTVTCCLRRDTILLITYELFNVKNNFNYLSSSGIEPSVSTTSEKSSSAYSSFL
jgi:hypothetical protein